MSAASEANNDGNTAIARPEFIPEDIWLKFCELGNSVADFVMDAFAVYEWGNFALWDKIRARNMVAALCKIKEEDVVEGSVFEYILIEKMKKKEFFCCDICKEVYFNYKQALIHFTSIEHCKKETVVAIKSEIDSFRCALDLLTKLPEKLHENAAKIAQERRERYGSVTDEEREHLRPSAEFDLNLTKSCAHLTATVVSGVPLPIAAADAIRAVKGDFGRKAMAELHDHLGKEQTVCTNCECKTGDREGFYYHILSCPHISNTANFNKVIAEMINREAIPSACFDPLTVLVNVHKKYLIDENMKEKEVKVTSDEKVQPVKKASNPKDPASKSNPKTTVSRPDSILEDIWQSYYKLGNTVTDFVLDAFDVYASGDFANYDKDRARNISRILGEVKGRTRVKRRNRVCEYILVEKMKEKEFFCCDPCQETFFNYKQVLIHFMTAHHHDNEAAAVKDSGIEGFTHLLNSFTDLPEKLMKTDMDGEISRYESNPSSNKAARTKICEFHRDRAKYFATLVAPDGPEPGVYVSHSLLVDTQKVVEKVKGELGKKALNEVHEFLGQGPTYCIFCELNTCDREGFYAHYISYAHIKGAAKELETRPKVFRFDPLTTLINVHRRDLI